MLTAAFRQRLLELARLSEAAYWRPEIIAAVYPTAEFVSVEDTQALILPGERYTSVVFRGTQVAAESGLSWGDIVANVRIGKVRLPGGGRAHAGYVRSATAAWPRCREIIHRLGKPHIVSGHSLGGAVATLAALARPAPLAAITFGSPRVGDAALAKRLSGAEVKLYRIVHEDDVAPKWPPAIWGYRHGGEHLHLYKDGRLEARPWGFWDWAYIPLTKEGIAGLRDHDVRDYVRALSLP